MRKLLTILFLLFDLICLGQTSNPDFTLSLDFAPSFTYPSNLTICSKQDFSSIELTVYRNRDKKKVLVLNQQTMLPKLKTDTLVSFLKTYKFRIKVGADTTDVRKVFRNGDSLTVYTIRIGVDGITVHGTFTQGNIVKKFAFWSPPKETENHKFMELVFSLLYESISEEKIVNYMDQLEDYFSLEFGLKRKFQIMH